MYEEEDRYYEPSEEEIKEYEKLARDEEEQQDIEHSIEEKKLPNVKNRMMVYFSGESHWRGWLRVNGMLWL